MSRLRLSPHGEAVWNYMKQHNIFWIREAERQMLEDQKKFEILCLSQQLELLTYRCHSKITHEPDNHNIQRR